MKRDSWQLKDKGTPMSGHYSLNDTFMAEPSRGKLFVVADENRMSMPA
jgi:hypothetical protein